MNDERPTAISDQRRSLNVRVRYIVPQRRSATNDDQRRSATTNDQQPTAISDDRATYGYDISYPNDDRPTINDEGSATCDLRPATVRLIRRTFHERFDNTRLTGGNRRDRHERSFPRGQKYRRLLA